MESRLSESRELSRLLLSTSDLAREIFAEISARLSIPVPVARALCVLEKPEHMSGLASKLGCDKSYITPLTDQMESLGFVRRVPGKDRRTKEIELTRKGKDTRRELESHIALKSPVMTGLSQDERQTLRVLLSKIAVRPSESTSISDGSRP